MRWPRTGLRSMGLYGPPIPMLETCRICSANERCRSSSRSIVSCGNRGSSPPACMKVSPRFCPGTGGSELIPMAPGLARTRSDDMNIDLTGRSAIVTGGSKGIGLAVAARFAASGADVAIVSRGRAGLDEAAMTIGATARGKVLALQGDVAGASDISRTYEQAMQAFGKLDIVMNNAGESRTGAFEQITDEMWREDFDQKLFAAIRLTRLAWPQMKERRWGRVINTLNIGAKAPRGGQRADNNHAGRRHGADQGARWRRRAAQYFGERAAGRADRSRPACAAGGADRRRSQGLHECAGPGNSPRPHGAAGRVRQYRLLPGLRRGFLHHGHGDQRRRRPLAGNVGGFHPRICKPCQRLTDNSAGGCCGYGSPRSPPGRWRRRSGRAAA